MRPAPVRLIRALMIVAIAACSGDRESGVVAPPPPSSSPPPAGNATIVLNSAVRHQMIAGWEATAQAGYEHPSFPLFADSLFTLIVNDLGVNRIRLEVRSGAENTRDWYADWIAGTIDDATWRCHRYETVNDNADPATRNDVGFRFTDFDTKVEKVVLPIRSKLQARGEQLFLNVNYVAFENSSCARSAVHDNPAEYAEFVLATVQHMHSRYGLVPDSWEVVLEPDNTSFWRGTQIGRAIVAAANRLAAAGYDDITFIAPSNTNMSNAVAYFDDLAAVPGALQHLTEISYHRYGGVSTSALNALASRARQYGKGTAMLEHIGSGYADLHADLSVGLNAAWQQYTLAFPGTSDAGGSLYRIDVTNPSAPQILPGSRTPYLRQYFRYVRGGAQRIGATSRVSSLDPLGFINPNGHWVVVVKAAAAATFDIGGLPAGRYGISHTTAGGAGVEAPPVTVGSDGKAIVSIPSAGVLTFYRTN